jgi:hypothetical protein
MTDAASWPDPERPGVPLNPERDGWHWLIFANGERVCCWWQSATNGWNSSDAPSAACDYPPEQAAQDHVGCEPCLLPSEVAAREVAAAQEMREACVAECQRRAKTAPPIGDDWGHSPAEAARLAKLTAALPLPVPGALDRALAEAERRGMERERARYAGLMSALAGLMCGEDWNHGTHAQRHGYRKAVTDAYAATTDPAA